MAVPPAVSISVAVWLIVSGRRYGDGLPVNPQALLAYFPSPQEAADFMEAVEAMKKTQAR